MMKPRPSAVRPDQAPPFRRPGLRRTGGSEVAGRYRTAARLPRPTSGRYRCMPSIGKPERRYGHANRKRCSSRLGSTALSRGLPNTTAQLRRRAGRFEPRRREDAKERRSNTSVFAFVWASRPRGFAVQFDAATTKLRCSANATAQFGRSATQFQHEGTKPRRHEAGRLLDRDACSSGPLFVTLWRRPGAENRSRAVVRRPPLLGVELHFISTRFT